MSTRIVCALCASICLLTAATGTYADTALTPVELGGVTYVTGGIGSDEVAAFRDVASRYNLRMTFASKTGEYLSDVDVTIQDGMRHVLTVRTTGPLLYVRLPKGRYTVSARDRHIHETKRVAVDAHRGVDIRFYWEDPDQHDVMRLCSGCAGTGRHRVR
ncbi:carboxypeptidase regulatory-like domain-containing protein [Burkholderia contaminans]|uniref:carboxypeptidase regulatory-like domain-containing protein n=2 Tax=Burkholderia contaminans TaxID=488447 RepID=UPI001453E7A8|nr:carboxypeptidase regulatory-like domain-containing protein [Burkholderia contaminans]MCA8150774.1 carboxypeptidase regulatory-like domain-containing protein [Burkholderia contaminans]VWD51006.1 carboxypeptidase regulatory-like domain protein [Burkholderia contaminans]